MQEEAPPSLEKVSAGQEVQEVAPAEEYDPAEHVSHFPLLKYLPAVHEQTDEPDEDVEPLGQVVQVPPADEYWLAEQAKQEEDFSALLEPAEQAVQAAVLVVPPAM